MGFIQVEVFISKIKSRLFDLFLKEIAGMEILKVHELSARFGEREVLKEVTLSIESNSWLSVVGESGSGKSLTALSILNLLEQKPIHYTSGEFSFFASSNNKNAISLPPREMNQFRGKGISMIFQEPMTALNPAIICGKQIAEAMEGDTEKFKERVISLLKEVKLQDPDEVFNKFPHQLSGGQRQRVMIAMALAGNPRLLIADEPTTALDPTVQNAILQLLKKLQQERSLAILFISHDLEAVAAVSDRIMVMQKGLVVEAGDAIQILKSPQHSYTKGLLACKPKKENKNKKLQTLQEESCSPKEFKFLYSQENILDVENISVKYPGASKSALKGVSFSINKGQSLALIGESGSGKTTLSKIVLGLLSPSAGQVKWKGETVCNPGQTLPKRLRSKIQMVFQDPFASLNPKHTIEFAINEILSINFPKYSYAEKKEKCKEILHQVGLDSGALKKYPHHFSGGQRQRIVIAKALATEPELLICDEAVAALDVSIQSQILNLLNELREQRGLSYLFISHDFSVVYHMCDLVLVIQNGEIIESAPIEELFNSPKQEYTKELILSSGCHL
ncbi:MAG: dipeptide ABC transporter ATP-binding protein [Bacteroidota bacterium]